MTAEAIISVYSKWGRLFKRYMNMNNFSNINGININVPKEFDGIVPVSPNSSFFAYEPFSFIGCREGIREGDIVFDLGVSYGIMTTLFAKMAEKFILSKRMLAYFL